MLRHEQAIAGGPALARHEFRLGRYAALLISLGFPLSVRVAAASAQAEARTASETQSSLAFRVTFDPNLQPRPYSGRVLVVVANALSDEPRLEINNWFRPPHVFGKDVKEWLAGESTLVDDAALFFPRRLSELPSGEYRIQAVARRSLDDPVPGQGTGDLYSAPVALALDPAQTGPLDLRLDRVVAAQPFEESSGVKSVEFVSSLLSKFHGRDIQMRAAVVLPAGWTDDPRKRYPVLYMIPGFGGDHRMAKSVARMRSADSPGHHVLFVVPDPTCFRGHSVFADSENNGPWGQALVEELIPRVEKRFHGEGSGRHRYVTGVSSGGWSALWLQVTYPDEFNGCWAHCPDPVDFRDFQQINLYAEGANMFFDDSGLRRPLARFGEKIMIYYEDFVRHDEILAPGGQIHSFEAVFSPRLTDGRPAPLFDRATGKVNPDIARAWERYDVRLVLERNWPTLGLKLRGKLYIYAGQKDTFYLEGAVARLKGTLTNLGSDADVTVVPDMAHGLHAPAIEPMYRVILETFADGQE